MVHMNVAARLPYMPAPFLDEVFGSWFQRCANAYHTSSTELMKSILAAAGESTVLDFVDLDTEPPPVLLKALASLTPFRESELEYLVVRGGPATLPRRSRDSYCPQCLKSDIAAHGIYVRRSWLDAWTISCSVHDCLLGRMGDHDSTESISAQVTSALGLRKRLTVRPMALAQVKLTENPRLNAYCSSEAHWFDPQMLKSIVGRDLLLLAGSEQADGLYNRVFGHYRGRRQVWRDGEGNALWWSDVAHPLGTIDVRVSAAHLAGLLWKCFQGTAASRRYRAYMSKALYEGCWTNPREAVMATLVERWPREDRERWRSAFP
jgi:hypothetical protein